MLKLRLPAIVILILLTMAGFALFRSHTKAATIGLYQGQHNKFAGHWVSHITTSAGDEIDDGVIEISDVNPASSDRVKVSHSFYRGVYTAYTLPYPDRIEIQIPLGDGRVAHYNGVLTSRNKIEGRHFITSDQQSHHAKRSANVDEEYWVATSTPPS